MLILQFRQPEIRQSPAKNERRFKREIQAIVLHDFVAIKPQQLTIKKVSSTCHPNYLSALQ